jgi:hypothetical protein
VVFKGSDKLSVKFEFNTVSFGKVIISVRILILQIARGYSRGSGC